MITILDPYTPRGELVKRMKEKEAQNKQGRCIRFRIVEKGGITLEQKLGRSNPWSKEKCSRPKYFLAEERVEETVGVRASPSPSTARSAARRWPPTRGRVAEMDSAEDVSI